MNIYLAVVAYIHNKKDFMKFTEINNNDKDNEKKSKKKKNKNRKLIISLPFFHLFIKHSIWSRDDGIVHNFLVVIWSLYFINHSNDQTG